MIACGCRRLYIGYASSKTEKGAATYFSKGWLCAGAPPFPLTDSSLGMPACSHGRDRPTDRR